MSNLFDQIKDGVHNVETRFLGQDYDYYKFIKTPSEIGMTEEGSISALAKDIDGLVNYVELLVTGQSNASATGKPLGDKFFLPTAAKCTDKSTGQDVDRYIYIDNVPEGNIPFISSGLGVNFSEFKGLIPGAVSDLNVLNPITIFQAFLSGGKQECTEVTMDTIDSNNNRSSETHFVSLLDLKNMDPCSFPDKYNRFSDKHCKETFTSMNKKNKNSKYVFKTPNDPIVQSYFASLGVLGIYILYCLMTKMKK